MIVSKVELYNFVIYELIFFIKQKTAYEMRISDWSSDVCSSDLSIFLVSHALGWLAQFQDAAVMGTRVHFHFHHRRRNRGSTRQWRHRCCSPGHLLRYFSFSLCIIARRGLLALCRILLLVSEDKCEDVQRDFGEIAFMAIFFL